MMTKQRSVTIPIGGDFGAGSNRPRCTSLLFKQADSSALFMQSFFSSQTRARGTHCSWLPHGTSPFGHSEHPWSATKIAAMVFDHNPLGSWRQTQKSVTRFQFDKHTNSWVVESFGAVSDMYTWCTVSHILSCYLRLRRLVSRVIHRLQSTRAPCVKIVRRATH